jgi:hypothetical protein
VEEHLDITARLELPLDHRTSHLSSDRFASFIPAIEAGEIRSQSVSNGAIEDVLSKDRVSFFETPI